MSIRSGAYDAGTLNATRCFSRSVRTRHHFSASAGDTVTEVRQQGDPRMKIALVAQHATPLHPRTGAGPDSDDIGLSELTRKLAAHGHQVTVFAQKHQPDLPVQAELHDGVRVTHINAGPVPIDGDR